jgi:cytochrome c
MLCGAKSGTALTAPEFTSVPTGGLSMRLFITATTLVLASATASLAQDAASGEKIFAQCKACHQIGANAKNAVGPVLNGLFGRKAGTIEGYSYSPANKNSGIVWDEATFAEYIKDPKAKVPGTKMIYPGLKDEKRIQDLIAFLKQYDASGNRASNIGRVKVADRRDE